MAHLVTVSIVVEADTAEEAREGVAAILPGPGPVIYGEGDVCLIVSHRVNKWAPRTPHSVILDAAWIRDEVEDPGSVWSGPAVEAFKGLSDQEICDEISNSLSDHGDHFWSAMDQTRDEVIRALLDSAGVPEEEREA